MELLERVKEDTGLSVQCQVPGSSLTTFRIGGPLEYFAEPQNPSQLSSLLKILDRAGQKVQVIGAGSNLLISSQGLKGWFIRLAGEFEQLIEIGENEFQAGSACFTAKVSRELCQRGFTGMEFCAGIPGTIGGAVFMNAGAFGGQTADALSEISCINREGTVCRYRKEELKWQYRHLDLPEGAVVCSASFKLQKGDKQEIAEKRDQYQARRKAKQPSGIPCAGSIFMNPSREQPAGKLIEGCGLKGRRIGGALVSTMHANWIVNESGTAGHADVVALIELCKAEVLKTFGISMNCELRIWE